MIVESLDGRRVIWNGTPGPITFHFGPEADETADKCWPPRIDALGIVLTNYCPLACRHCYNNSSPRGEDMLAADDIKAFVTFLLADGHALRAVGLSGGEAHYHPEFFEIAEFLANLGLYVSCNTGGHGLSAERLKEMQRHGVKEAVFSSDSYHEKFVSGHNLFDLIEESAKLFEQTTVKIAVESRSEGERRLERLDSILDKKVDIVIQPVLKIGRASSNRFRDVKSWSPSTSAAPSNCAEEFRALGINYDGRVYACCSVGSFTPGLELYSIRDHASYRAIRQQYEMRKDLKRIHAAGWGRCVLEETGMHKCEMCHSQLKGSVRGEALEPLEATLT